eukprot:TRINITY_DN2617_c0_g3_i3.p1 TRINITY_DN2617_c0_g3~~TRINITY_DN2617_c0_g3_i3.p1  ORF type:complete len:421 (-),score=91.74 TRINITY_DN2617_c0_g3_i3:460-1722(-)
MLKKRNRLMKGDDYDVLREVAIMKKLTHPNVVSLFEVMDDPSQDEFYMVFEYVEGGPVMSGNVENEPFPEDLARRYFRDVIMGLHYIHQHNIIHRDLKPENLLLTKDDHLKISDFGVSIVCIEKDDSIPVLKDTVGSPAFFAPEMLTGRSYAGRPIDIWAAGVTLYNFVYGRCPFMADTTVKIFEMIRSETISFPFATNPQLEDLLNKMLDKDPQTRITMESILVHPWVTKNGAQPLVINDVSETLPATVSDEEIRRAMDNFMVVGKSLRSQMNRIQAEGTTLDSASSAHLPHTSSTSSNTQTRSNLGQTPGSQSLLELFEDIHKKLTVMQTTMVSREQKFVELESRLGVCESELSARGQRFDQLKQRLKELSAHNQQAKTNSSRKGSTSAPTPTSAALGGSPFLRPDQSRGDSVAAGKK